MPSFSPSYKPFGKSAILIEWPPEMNDNILKDILSFQQKIKDNNIEGIIETIQSIHSLTVVYESNNISYHFLKQQLKNIYDEDTDKQPSVNYLWKIPVCYDYKFGLDLKEISIGKRLPVEKIIELHTRAIYLVYSIGFLPGFLYLGGLDERLYFDRKSAPRLKIPKGAVAIGGMQTGIYPNESPGGWQIIGNTPVSFFNKTKVVPCFAKPGDKIQFIRIPFEKYKQIQLEILSKRYTLKKEVVDD